MLRTRNALRSPAAGGVFAGSPTDLFNGGAVGHLGAFQLQTTMWLTSSRMFQPAFTGPGVGMSVSPRPSIWAEDLRFCDSDPSAHTSDGGHEMTGLVTGFDIAAADGTW